MAKPMVKLVAKADGKTAVAAHPACCSALQQTGWHSGGRSARTAMLTMSSVLAVGLRLDKGGFGELGEPWDI